MSQVGFYYVNFQRTGKRCLVSLPCGLGLCRCLCSLTELPPCQAFFFCLASSLRGVVVTRGLAQLCQPWALVVHAQRGVLSVIVKELVLLLWHTWLALSSPFCGLPFLSLRSWRGRLASALLYLAALVAFSPLPLLLARMFHAYAWPWLGLPLCACKRALNLRS